MTDAEQLKRLRQTIRRNKYWHEAIDGGFRLNASGAWDDLDSEHGGERFFSRDLESGDPCTVTVEDGDVHWRWQWDNGYDEHLSFATVREWSRFFRHFMQYGIGDTDYADFDCAVLDPDSVTT